MYRKPPSGTTTEVLSVESPPEADVGKNQALVPFGSEVLHESQPQRAPPPTRMPSNSMSYPRSPTNLVLFETLCSSPALTEVPLAEAFNCSASPKTPYSWPAVVLNKSTQPGMVRAWTKRKVGCRSTPVSKGTVLLAFHRSLAAHKGDSIGAHVHQHAGGPLCHEVVVRSLTDYVKIIDKRL